MTKQSRRQIVLSLIAVIPALSLFNCAVAQAPPSHEVIWKEFLEWLSKAPRVDGPALFNTYRDLLIKAGISTQEADQRLDVIRRMHRERPDGWRVMFNNIYASKEPGFATEPNALLIGSQTGTRFGHRN